MNVLFGPGYGGPAQSCFQNWPLANQTANTVSFDSWLDGNMQARPVTQTPQSIFKLQEVSPEASKSVNV